MPPIRRYVRISPHSCLEVRIFVDNPADISTWLLRPSNPALPRVFNAVRPFILPKLREENERARLAKGKSGKKKKNVKDVVKTDDFEVVIFLTEAQGRHEVVVKRREAREGGFGRTSRTGLTGEDEPVIIPEEADEEDVDIRNIPAAISDDEDEIVTIKAGRKRKAAAGDASEGEEMNDFQHDEKKKIGFKTRYDGFGIWGKVLCLLVERKGGSVRGTVRGDRSQKLHAAKAADGPDGNEGAQQALMQEWISSTQLPQDEDDDR